MLRTYDNEFTEISFVLNTGKTPVHQLAALNLLHKLSGPGPHTKELFSYVGSLDSGPRENSTEVLCDAGQWCVITENDPVYQYVAYMARLGVFLKTCAQRSLKNHGSTSTSSSMELPQTM